MIRNNTKLSNPAHTYTSFRKSLGGFTIVELMIATTVFSVILLLCATALVQIGRVYYKGVVSGKTQNTTRSIMDEIASAIKYSGDSVVSGVNVLCVGNLRYSFWKDQQLNDTNHVLIADRPAVCNPGVGYSGPSCTPPGCRELLSPRMRLSKFNIIPPPAGSNLYGIEIGVVSGENDLLEDDPTKPSIYHKRCKAALNAGGQFCAASELTTYVQKRL